MTLLKINHDERAWLLPAGLILAGLLIAGSAPWLFSHERWVMDDPDRREHVFTLVSHQERLYRGSQDGVLRVRDGTQWREIGRSPEQTPIMFLFPARELAVLNRGLWKWADNSPIIPPDPVRVSHAAQMEQALALGTERGVLTWDGSAFHDLGLDAQVYRLHVERHDAGETLHAGTIATGMWHQVANDAWQPNNEGLPEPVNILSLLEADNGVLLAGTDQGLYWQAAPGERWRRMDAGLGQRRILALAIDDAGWLWAGSDDGARRVRLVQREQALESQGRWEKLRNPPRGLDRPVSWVVPLMDEVWISAGAVYRLDRVSGRYLYQQLAVGLLLIALALYLLRKQTTGSDHG